MPRDPRYDVLFEPVQIGPVTAPNRFYQVPHCNGMGYRDVAGMTVMRGIKAEGGWGVVCTEQCEIHHSSDITPFIELRLWDERDVPALERVAQAVHKHGALAGLELAYNGMNAPNLSSREVPMGPSHLPVASFTYDPVQARAMDKQDIADLRRWHRTAALRAKRAGFDIVYVYAAHALSGLQHFLSRRHNDRGDEYGGSLENRVRIVRELTEDAKEAVGDSCAVALRFSVDELLGPEGLHREEAHDMIGLLAEIPDLWDITLSDWSNDSQTSRFGGEGAQEPFVAGIKGLTSKPVVGVGRFTSPDAMVAQIKRGVLDLIGAARPSIADPFLPRKVEEGRIEDIRECIGCNICVSGDMTMSPNRCTQNPTKGEEWRRGWHPERIATKASDAKVLVVGAGPAGLECARALGARGYEVALAEAGMELGGRVAKECRLPGLSAWGRVRDHRVQQMQNMTNVETYLDSRLTAEQILEFGFEHVAIATGASWRRDGVARFILRPISIAEGAEVLTPDDLMAGKAPSGKRVVLYDDDHYYMGGVLAELLVAQGRKVTLVTPAPDVSNWTHNTLEQGRIQTRLLELGIAIEPHRAVTAVRAGGIETACVFTGRKTELACDSLVLVTARLPNESLIQELTAKRDAWKDAGILSVKAIGDALAPATIAVAVYAGHRYARELDGPETGDDPPFKRELTEVLPL
ncbi:MAG: FAD-dependent oxidoreductase [Rhodospirillales bacterium]|nr:FAD-dependent oxidoreductase [Rhodospirillales bacterium]